MRRSRPSAWPMPHHLLLLLAAALHFHPVQPYVPRPPSSPWHPSPLSAMTRPAASSTGARCCAVPILLPLLLTSRHASARVDGWIGWPTMIAPRPAMPPPALPHKTTPALLPDTPPPPWRAPWPRPARSRLVTALVSLRCSLVARRIDTDDCARLGGHGRARH